jgi:hypothetical protein
MGVLWGSGPGPRMRQDSCRFPSQQYLAPQLARHFRGISAEGGLQPRPHLPLLEVEARPAGPGELTEQFLELRVAGRQRVQLGENLPDLELGADGPVGERAAAGDMLADGRPQVQALDVGVLGFLDDQLLGHHLAQHQLILAGAGRRGRALLELGQHLPDLLMVLGQDFEHVLHLCLLSLCEPPQRGWVPTSPEGGA